MDGKGNSEPHNEGKEKRTERRHEETRGCRKLNLEKGPRDGRSEAGRSACSLHGYQIVVLCDSILVIS